MVPSQSAINKKASIAQRYEQPRSDSRPTLNSVRLTDEEFLVRRDKHLKIDALSQAASAASTH